MYCCNSWPWTRLLFEEQVLEPPTYQETVTSDKDRRCVPLYSSLGLRFSCRFIDLNQVNSIAFLVLSLSLLPSEISQASQLLSPPKGYGNFPKGQALKHAALPWTPCTSVEMFCLLPLNFVSQCWRTWWHCCFPYCLAQRRCIACPSDILHEKQQWLDLSLFLGFWDGTMTTSESQAQFSGLWKKLWIWRPKTRVPVPKVTSCGTSCFILWALVSSYKQGGKV